jgi:hypothetical protein
MMLRSAAAIVTFALAAQLSSSPPAERIGAEITRVATGTAEVLPADSRGAIASRLERAKSAAAAGNIYLALYDLQVGFEAEAGYRFAGGRKEVPDYAAFTRKWTETGPPAAPPTTKAGVLFVEALAQSAEGRAPATYKASLPYAQDAGLDAGLYYLGESHAMVRFASFCRGLPLTTTLRAPALRSIEPELSAYEKQVVAAYDRAPAGQRPQYAGVSVAIKIARTLDEQKRHEGALLQYLVSRFRFALLSIPERQASPLDQIRARVGSMKLPADADHSVAEFFLQLAAATLNARDGTPGSAIAVLDDVLPAYFVVVNK